MSTRPGRRGADRGNRRRSTIITPWGRPEQPIDPAAGPISALAGQLRELRRAAGGPTYRELARRAHYSYTTLAAAAGLLVLAVAILVSASRGAPSRPKVGLYQVMIANDCPPPSPATASVVADPGDGWAVGTVGGYRGDGCYGEYLFQRDDAGVPAGRRGGVHWRLTGAPTTPMTCQLSVHIADSLHSAGPAGYAVSSAGSTPPARTDMDQSRHRGEWIGLGSCPVTGGTVEVDMHPPAGSAAEVTAGPIRLYCPVA